MRLLARLGSVAGSGRRRSVSFSGLSARSRHSAVGLSPPSVECPLSPHPCPEAKRELALHPSRSFGAVVVQGSYWPKPEQPLWRAQRQQSDVRSRGLPTAAVDPQSSVSRPQVNSVMTVPRAWSGGLL